ncbi:metal ABC transporter solute-binding protein, Zn/Mn family [Gloeocapsa sp. PCC 73106]|uniref:metal ABC transporter solute-binding protein, Zn/Mn family n=1 Tax=Gloeocapsa sp. PCC 73106 TaxID=102232 RepID=UPI0002EA630D|nr:zinc ABC transporter substrate-binding protein [Gloeocapsa sp. PCC 73106]
MKRITQIAIGLTLLGVWFGGFQATGQDEQLNVVSTSTIIADLTATVGGDAIEHQGLLTPGDDPHLYEPVPRDVEALEKADLIIYNGFNLEPALIRLIEAAGVKAQKLAVGEKVTPLKIEKEGARVPDPHVWGSAENGIIMVNAIRDQLIELSPENAAQFTENAAQLTAELAELHAEIKEQIATIPEDQRFLVTTHDAFGYYAEAYGIPVAGTLIGISTEEQPSAQTLKALVDEIKNLGVKAIFAETTINPSLIETVAQEAGVEIAPRKLYSDSIGVPGSEAGTYPGMLRTNTQTIVEALGN